MPICACVTFQAKTSTSARHSISRYFMRAGWGDTEAWGVRTVEKSALLAIFPASVPEAGLVVDALVIPFLAKGKSGLTVDVSVNGAKIAQWDFNRRERHFGFGTWRQAKIPRHLCGVVDEPNELHITFTMSEVASPRSLNLSSDSRTLGLGLRKLSLGSIEGNGWWSLFQRQLRHFKFDRCVFNKMYRATNILTCHRLG